MYKVKLTMFIKCLSAAAITGIIVFAAGCKSSVNGPEATVNNQTSLSSADKQAMTQIADQDSVLATFSPNFNESETDNYLAKTNSAINPLFVWQHFKLTDKSYDFNQAGDSVYLKITKTFAGVLNIAASTQGTTSADTIITKNFTSIVTRQLLFERIDSTDNPLRNWRLVGISLASGGTNTGNFSINKLTLTLSNGDQIIIDSPENYFISREDRWHWWHHFPEIQTNDTVTVSVEVYSAYADTDFVTVTYGASLFGFHRHKAMLNLVSETPNGTGYTRVFERTFNVMDYRGYFHAVLNAFTRQTIYDDTAAVESQTWGVPYRVK